MLASPEINIRADLGALILVLGDASGRSNISLSALILVFGCTTITPGVANPPDKGQSVPV